MQSKKIKIKCVFCIVLIIIASLGFVSAQIITKNKANGIETEQNNKDQKEQYKTINEEITIELSFCDLDDCAQVFEDFFTFSRGDTSKEDDISRLNIPLSCAFFELEKKQIIGTIAKRQSHRIVLDENSEPVQEIANNNTRIIRSAGYMHNKFCTDSVSKVWTGSWNPKERKNENRNVVVAIESQTLAQEYQKEFEELWQGKAAQGKPSLKVMLNATNQNTTVKFSFCPEDSCSEQVQQTISKAKHSIYFMTFSFTDKKIAEQIINAKQRNISIEGIMEPLQLSASIAPMLLQNNISLFKEQLPALMHHKVFIIDNQTIIIGSYNPSANADRRNDENLLIISDKASTEKMIKEYERLRAKSIKVS